VFFSPTGQDGEAVPPSFQLLTGSEEELLIQIEEVMSGKALGGNALRGVDHDVPGGGVGGVGGGGGADQRGLGRLSRSTRGVRKHDGGPGATAELPHVSFFAVSTLIGGEENTEPRYLVISFATHPPRIMKQATASKLHYRSLFFERYPFLVAEWSVPPSKSVVGAMLVAYDTTAPRDAATSVATVPIWTWKEEHGGVKFMSPGGRDGGPTPPSFSVLADSEEDLLTQVEKVMTGQKNERPAAHD
jgi:hypothetical protein